MQHATFMTGFLEHCILRARPVLSQHPSFTIPPHAEQNRAAWADPRCLICSAVSGQLGLLPFCSFFVSLFSIYFY